jgi:putative chitinase
MRLDEKYKTLFVKNEVNTPLRLAHFMAQMEHESNLKPIAENLNYSAEGLIKTFKKYFPTIESTVGYARNPIRIANKVYANRMGNGNEASGDGYKFRGRGFIQLTGKDNHAALSKDTKIDFVANPDLLLQEANALIAALWFWKKNGLSVLADKDNLDAISDKINMGRITVAIGDAKGYQDRKGKLDKWKIVFTKPQIS